jgi:hypothetical protein
MAGKGVSVTSYAQITGGNDLFRGVSGLQSLESPVETLYVLVAKFGPTTRRHPSRDSRHDARISARSTGHTALRSLRCGATQLRRHTVAGVIALLRTTVDVLLRTTCSEQVRGRAILYEHVIYFQYPN